MELHFESICLDATPEARSTMMQRIGSSVDSLPQIFVNGEYVGGYKELVEWYDEHEDDDYSASQSSSDDEVPCQPQLSLEEEF